MTSSLWITIGVIASVVATFALPYGFHLKAREEQNANLKKESQYGMPKLNIFLRIIKYIDVVDKNKQREMVNILVINDGDSSIIISRCEYLNDSGGKGDIGIYDELKAPYGIAEIVLPALIQPAGKFSLNFLGVSAIEHITKISLIDSHDNEYEVSQVELTQIKEQYRRSLKH